MVVLICSNGEVHKYVGIVSYYTSTFRATQLECNGSVLYSYTGVHKTRLHPQLLHHHLESNTNDVRNCVELLYVIPPSYTPSTQVQRVCTVQLCPDIPKYTRNPWRSKRGVYNCVSVSPKYTSTFHNSSTIVQQEWKVQLCLGIYPTKPPSTPMTRVQQKEVGSSSAKSTQLIWQNPNGILTRQKVVSLPTAPYMSRHHTT